jgi:thiazole/oxazole-forming peptide maturase SagD family component
MALVTSNMPDYHKLVVHANAEMVYHLAGYGIYQEEAMVRLLGEGIERYGLMVAGSLHEDKMFRASYADLRRETHVMPWEYINIYSQVDYERMSAKTNIRPITQDDTISWLWCPSLFNPHQQICVPAQLLFTGLRKERLGSEKLFVPGFSKGAAAHVTVEKALKGAILESIEADAFMIRWYAAVKARRLLMDDLTLLSIMSTMMSELDYEVVAFDFTLPDIPGYTTGIGLVNQRQDRPVVLFGCCSSLDPAIGVYRALVEALAIHYLARNGPVIVPEHYLNSAVKRDYNNLDSNVAYWSNMEDADAKRAFIRQLVAGEVALSGLASHAHSDAEDLSYLLNGLRKVSQYAVWLDITPPEIAGQGWKVIRTFFPELLQMSLPAYPYSNHPRLVTYGGVRNELPHPSP